MPSAAVLPSPRIIITGTGRAGTTFLVQLLTELGEDTGYTPETWRKFYDAHCAAGLEHDLTAADGPRWIKNPNLCTTLPGLLQRGAVAVEHAIIPVRGLEEAARSRIWIGGSGETPGGLSGTSSPGAQKSVLAENFHRLVQTLVEHEVPVTFLAFPRFVRDADYAWKKLRPLLPATDRARFFDAFQRTARPELVHDFSRGLPAGAGQAGADYERQKRVRRARWRRRRWLGLAAIIAAICAAGWFYG